MAKVPVNAWREIMARIFEAFKTEYNVSPNWLVNPQTNRRLKLDLLYPQIGVAVRFQGLKGKQQRGPESLQDKLERRRRDEARQKVCAEHNISLAILDLAANEPEKVFNELELAMSRASRRLAKDTERHLVEKIPLVEQLSQARSRASQFSREIKTPRDLNLYAELWIDRQYRDEVSAPASNPAPSDLAIPQLSAGMIVEHSHFGPGLVQTVTPSGDDALVVIDFGDVGQKTFMASLLADKIKLN